MSMEAAANSKNITILLEKKTEKAIVIGDVDRMEQVIRNLLKNAIRATENGTIRVVVEARQGEVVLTVEDNGIGIAPEELSHIWDRFYRVKNQRSSYVQEKGSGLGLVIVKKLVQLQSGNIEVESQLGKGTTFSISFPAFNRK
jgi:signal transduction histidine kinase